MVVVEMSTVSGAIPLNLSRGFAADCFTTDSVVRERTGTMPHKNDFYCFAVLVPLIIERSFVNCPRDAARSSGCKGSCTQCELDGDGKTLLRKKGERVDIE